MDFKKQVAATKIRISKSVIKSKLGTRINETILAPILSSIENEYDDLMHVIGSMIVGALQHVLMSSRPTGRTYRIVLVGEGEDKYEDIGEYTASAPGEPPNSIPGPNGIPTGTMLSAIKFEILSDGRLRVGIYDSPGTELETLFYAGGKIFVSENGGKKTSVVDYAAWLDEGTKNMEPRPWYHETLEQLKPVIRAKVKERLDRAVRRATRTRTIDKAVYFRVFFR